MTKWRPDDWNWDYCEGCSSEYEQCAGCGRHAYQDGADAILEALRKKGSHASGIFPLSIESRSGKEETLEIDKPIEGLGYKGTVIFIPDEEKVE